ncbi:unnamed protein product, partial [Medioppia subpectinata]
MVYDSSGNDVNDSHGNEDGSGEQLAHKTLVRTTISPNTTAGQIIRTTNGQTVVFTSMPSGNHHLKQG